MSASLAQQGDSRPSLLTLWVFLGAFLLFAVQPMAGRALLPGFGGAFQIWATTLMVFQGLLLVGYLYCHVLALRLGRWHLAVAALSLLSLPLAFELQVDLQQPVPSVLWTLLPALAAPFAVLVTTACSPRPGSRATRRGPTPIPCTPRRTPVRWRGSWPTRSSSIRCSVCAPSKGPGRWASWSTWA
ncbi:MAG: hypothetical protein JRI23_20810 [Deltaproteobacteria bacterium]|nr:hypothetical protein [Deltaproteobacteria bacterium]MBW2534360.1 hypothetical protein [Deltaproteobacteria bacterium]